MYTWKLYYVFEFVGVYTLIKFYEHFNRLQYHASTDIRLCILFIMCAVNPHISPMFNSRDNSGRSR